jgi:hypothetical protein
MTSNTQKVSGVIISLKKIHEIVRPSLEEREIMVTGPKKSFSIFN